MSLIFVRSKRRGSETSTEGNHECRDRRMQRRVRKIAAGPCQRCVLAPWHVPLACELHRTQHCFTTPSIFLLGVKLFPCWGSMAERGKAWVLPDEERPVWRSCDISSSVGLVLFGRGGGACRVASVSAPARTIFSPYCRAGPEVFELLSSFIFSWCARRSSLE